MWRLLHRARDVAGLFRQGHGGEVAGALRTRLSSRQAAYGMRRDLTQSLSAPPAKLELVVRPLTTEDDLSLLETVPGLSGEAAWIRRYERRLLESGLPTCWAAIAPDGKPCYLQWLIASKDNDRIHQQWGDLFPRLGPEEALLEAAYTPENYRGQGIMPNAMARIAEQAKDFGARYVMTFVTPNNIASLKGCRKAGFFPYVERWETWRLGRRRVHFTPLPEGFRFPYELESK